MIITGGSTCTRRDRGGAAPPSRRGRGARSSACPTPSGARRVAAIVRRRRQVVGEANWSSTAAAASPATSEPSRSTFHDELPKGATGKILQATLPRSLLGGPVPCRLTTSSCSWPPAALRSALRRGARDVTLSRPGRGGRRPSACAGPAWPPAEVDEVALGVNLPGATARSPARRRSSPACADDKRRLHRRPGVLLVARRDHAGLVVAPCSRRVGRRRRRWRREHEQGAVLPRADAVGPRLGDVVLKDQLVISCPYTGVPGRNRPPTRPPSTASDARPRTSGRCAASQRRWAAADARGAFDDED